MYRTTHMLITEYVFKHACNHAHYSVHLYRKPLETTQYYNTIALGKEPHKTTRSLYFLVLLSFISVTVFCCMFIFIMARCMVELVLRELHKFIFRFQVSLSLQSSFPEGSWDDYSQCCCSAADIRGPGCRLLAFPSIIAAGSNPVA